MKLALVVFVFLAGNSFAFSGSSAQQVTPAPRETPLFGFAAGYPGVFDQLELVTTYGFNSMTPGDAMKMSVIGGCDGVFDFSEADALLDLAVDLDLSVHGHIIVWHEQTSSCADSYTKADFESYVRTVMDYYCGKIESMDVVNEALADEGGYRGADQSAWYRIYGGPEYVADAFRFARDECPEMKLYYNDFANDYGPKAEEMLEMLKPLAEEGIIDGVGFQTHLTMGDFSLQRFGETMDAVAAMGLEFALSEVDLRWHRNYWDLTESDLQWQADFYRGLTQLCIERAACARFTVWGLDDGNTWINTWPSFGGYEDAPLLFDREFQPKPAYCDGVQPVLDLPQGACETDTTSVVHAGNTE